MARRLWIVAKKEQIEDNDMADALLNGCLEIANGVPPTLLGIVGALPCAYEEPEPPPIEPPHSSHIATLQAVNIVNARPARVKRVWQGNDYYHDCFVTQTVKNEYITGKIAIGDYVLVHFDDIGEQIITAKVFKSW